jgi:thiamine-monophosphate kinase
MKLAELNEFSSLQQFIQSIPRSPMQTHSFFHSDAEILQLSEHSFLALSLDIVSDEQAWGLISDPRLLGQHALETALSDLAAVGVSPKGFLQGIIIGRNHDIEFIKNVLAGINDAAQKHSLFLFGGDTASGQSFGIHLTVLGHSKTKPISRSGIKIGDKIYSTGKPGKGNALVAERWFNKSKPIPNENDFLAEARLKESQVIKKFASCMVDSSDGFLNSLDLLVRVNRVGVECTLPLASLLHPLAKAATLKYKLTPWSLLAGEFGDYELVFSVPVQHHLEFENQYTHEFKNLVFVGDATANTELKLKTTSGNMVSYDASIARNLYRNRADDQTTYLNAFLKLGKDLGF